MRRLSPSFMDALKNGILQELRQEVIRDKDLDLHVRDNYLNVYYKGNALLRLHQIRGARYKVVIHKKFLGDLVIHDLVDHETTHAFIAQLPFIKDKVARHGDRSLEIEYEQLIIRANNLEPRNNSEYIVIDRQYAIGKERFDLIGIFWDRNPRRRYQEVPLCFMEVKFALNSDIKDVHNQLSRYYSVVEASATSIADEQESILQQKLELGLFNNSRTSAIQTLRISRDFHTYQFVVVLVDYNPHSKRLGLAALAELPFGSQVRLFFTGFAMWNEKLQSPKELWAVQRGSGQG